MVTQALALPSELEARMRWDEDGGLRIGRTRVTLDTLIGFFIQGSSAEDLVRQFPTLALADVELVIRYYLAHREEVDAYLKRRDEEAAEIRRKIEATCPSDEWRARLLARRAQMQKP
jgi:uncharacterized protein (DUF433 family)